MFCENCGKENLEGAGVCEACGGVLKLAKAEVKAEVNTQENKQTALKVLLIVSFCVTAFCTTLLSEVGALLSTVSLMPNLFMTWPLAIIVFALGMKKGGDKTLKLLSIIDFLFTLFGAYILEALSSSVL